MANVRFEGGAVVTADTRTYAFAGTWEADDINRVQVGNKIKNVAAGSTVAATVVSTLSAAINALSAATYPEIVSTESGFTASANSTTLTLTANTAGVPFICTITPYESDGTTGADAQTIEGAGTAATGTVSVTNAGPEVYTTPANWDTGVAPVATNNVYIDNYADDILYGLSAAGATYASLNIALSMTGRIGLPQTNDLGTEYPEYRTLYLTVDATLVSIGYGAGRGSDFIALNNGTVQTAVTVWNTGRARFTELGAFIWKGTHASNTLLAKGNADVGIAVYGGEVATLATLTVDDNATVRCGVGTTLGTVVVHGGELTVNGAIGTSLTVYDGLVTINGTGAVAGLTIYGGRVVYNTTGTLGGTPAVYGGVLDFSQEPATKTVTNPIDVYGDGVVLDPEKVVSSLVIDYNGLEPISGLGVNVRVTRGTPA